MTSINADHINPFLMASAKILKDMCNIEAKIGRPYIKELVRLENIVVVIIGLTGELSGQVILSFEKEVACDVASRMMMMPVSELDELARSAISELGNMILGNTATAFASKGIGIDITPPTIGNGTMSFSMSSVPSICIPLEYEGTKRIEINVAIKR